MQSHFSVFFRILFIPAQRLWNHLLQGPSHMVQSPLESTLNH
ncbi:Uncharacterized protein APZ42_009957 [Daphnia magna]|uniref:Uncharacterized protein n=1 Tax=Daphnia magna TaxID=35525 RepID=A0A164DNJ7_9CRUS|nr:Uncharacterized protein APZ42_009957 [Daphnia magna]